MRITVNNGKIVKAELSSSAAQERSDEMRREDYPLTRNFKAGDVVTVLPAWKKHWSFRQVPAPTKSLWSKLIRPNTGVVTSADDHGNVWIADRWAQVHGEQGFPVLARFVKHVSRNLECGMDPDEGKCRSKADLLVRFTNDSFRQWQPVCNRCAEREKDMIAERKDLAGRIIRKSRADSR